MGEKIRAFELAKAERTSYLDRCQRTVGSFADEILRALLERGIRLTLILLLLVTNLAHGAEPAKFSEYQIKGAFLVKFAMFVDWPGKSFANARSPIVIGILGDDPFGPNYEAALSREIADGHPFVVKRFKEPSDVNDCHILFVSSSENQRLPEVFGMLQKRPILTVGDQERFAHRGGMVNFIKEGGKLRFEVNVAAADVAGLKVNSRLLQLAKPVTPEPTK
jgi:YfiR/HmsC-like